MSETVLEVRNLRVEFGSADAGDASATVKAVDDISFEVKRGQTLGIVGESGSGKSVTSLAIMGLLSSVSTQISGEIWFSSTKDGASKEPVNLLEMPSQEKQIYRGSQMATIFQEPMSSLNPVFTIGFQLTEAICLHQNVSQIAARRQAASLLQEVKLLPDDEELKQRCLFQKQQDFSADGPDGTTDDRDLMQLINDQKQAMLDRYPHQLSGGQIQRVMIAMAISCNPTLLIADEPTTALDVTVQATILALLRELRDSRGMAMIFITHDLSVIAEIADVVAVMYRGKIVECGAIEQIFSNPQHPYTKGLLACRPTLEKQLRRLPTVSDFMDVTTNASGELVIVEKDVDLDSDSSSGLSAFATGKAPRLPNLGAPLLTVNNLRVGFPVQGVFGETKRLFMAVNDISFEVYPGETLGLVGESGCGKSTLARSLLQLIPISSGQVFFEGQEITPPAYNISQWRWMANYRIQKEYARKLRWLRRDLQIIFQDPFSSLDPRMNVGAAVMEPMVIHSVGKNQQEQRDRAAYLLDRVGLNPDFMGRYPHEFSGGQRQRICIARALALNPKFIICDESVSALDVSVQAQVLNLLKELQTELGLTYMFISHDLSVVKFMSDRAIVMNQGKIEEIGTAERIYRQPQQVYTRQLIAAIPAGNLERIRQQQLGRNTSFRS
ncbi:MAG: ABC transporter ATP-binding protein [Tychonema bourrellyi B0820]|uniref:ABC transporter ATP-binding protein n=1 Tax=Tychonema bourrellyi FEM_GT703 TaxID=2040638 RepID=A0A2G4F669_9CYAN|nr:ABC transporter ATP-binding protein [Tychonema bourrellyi]MDQ2098697.1 ABC transporter ATP-binding protein [Tychonema bourrellyi B0820]PHX57239.1 ABC transporter ATP-binding protein [Tychonema bourrellyi FEM_GT703]